jgi:hypothetical protein
MDINDSMEEIVKSIATIEVNSSIRLFSAAFDSRMEVITNKQIPSKFAEVPKICVDVLFAMAKVKVNVIFS